MSALPPFFLVNPVARSLVIADRFNAPRAGINIRFMGSTLSGESYFRSIKRTDDVRQIISIPFTT